ncbi:MAG: hypothetical protein WC675_00600 [Patescibacteria group bacterium]|jgi:hypothetical protein
MKIYLPFEFQINLRIFFQRAGYTEFNDPNTGKSSYTKRLSHDYYPRFHLYVETDKDNRKFFNLHLDQKKPSYAGSSAHNAEYDSQIVIQEAERLKGLIKNQQDNEKQQQKPVAENRGFWSKLFH